jgi:hypothetical protein
MLLAQLYTLHWQWLAPAAVIFAYLRLATLFALTLAIIVVADA